MDSGLTRFALLIVLFLLLTGDITSMLRSFLDESEYSKSTTKTNLATKGTNEEANSDIESLAKSYSNRVKLINIIKESCLPKLICELTASSNRDSLTESERYLLTLIRYLDTCGDIWYNQDYNPLGIRLKKWKDWNHNTSWRTKLKDTSISLTAEVTSKYHFAAHMGQLINGIDSSGCHNFYPSCPYPGLQVMQMMKKVKIL